MSWLRTHIALLSNTTRFSYDPYGNVVSAADPLGNAARFAYDSVGDLFWTSSPTGVIASSTYDTNTRGGSDDHRVLGRDRTIGIAWIPGEGIGISGGTFPLIVPSSSLQKRSEHEDSFVPVFAIGDIVRPPV